MYRINNKKSEAFTMIELMLAMGFVAVLLLAIAMTVIQIGVIFNRGMAMKAVNDVSSSIATQLQTDVNNSPPFSLVASGDANRYYANSYGGRLCLSGYSYVWNYGAVLNGTLPSSGANTYNDGTLVRFAKVPDATNQMCKAASIKGSFGGTSTVLVDKASAIELLESGQYSLAIHDIIIASDLKGIDTKTNQQVYSIKLTLGTNVKNTLDNTTHICVTPNDPNYDSMCYSNYFTIVVRAGNKVQ